LGHHGDYNDGYWHAAMSPDGRLLASVAPDGLRLWDPFAFRASDRLLAYVPLKKCGSVSFFPDGSLLTAGSDGLLRWPLTVEADSTHLVLGPARALGAVPPFPVLGAAVSADGTTVAVATRRGQALVLGTDQQGRKVSLLDKALSYVAVSADGRWVATSTWFGGTGVKVWNARTGELAHDLPVKGSAWATFSRDGKWLMTTAGEQRLWSWKIDSWVPGLSFPAPGAVGLLPVFSQDSSVVAVPHSRNLVRLIDLASGREFASLPTTGGPCCFSPDGGQLVTGGENFALQVWDLRLIRQQLADLGLDWHLPSYPRAPAVDARKPLRVRVETGDR
jgi:WD40 repeat protein